jgi:hypothetical protein
VLGALTTLNAVITSYSRTIMRASRDEVLSLRLADIHPKHKVPHWSIVALSLPPILLVPVAPSAVVLSVFLALIILFGGFISAIALWNLPKRFPEAYEHSLYKLPMPILKLAAIGSAASSVVFWLLVVAQALPIVGTIVLIALVGYGYYRYRVAAYARQGIDLRKRLTLLHDHESVSAGMPIDDGQGGEPAPDAGGRAPAVAWSPHRPARSRSRPRRPANARTVAGAAHRRAPAGRGRTARGHDRQELAAALAELEGLGPAKAQALAEHFGSLEALRAAEPAELTRVPGVGRATAESVSEQLRRT